MKKLMLILCLFLSGCKSQEVTMPWWKWLDKLDAMVSEDNIFSWFIWLAGKLFKLFTQHYIMAPLATIGLIAIWIAIIKLWKANAKLTDRILKFEQDMDREGV